MLAGNPGEFDLSGYLSGSLLNGKEVYVNQEMRDAYLYWDTYAKDALEKAEDAIDKQIPMEHHHTKVGTTTGEKARLSICPSCLGCIITVEDEFPRFCTWCGQAIDWSERK
jgi:hypothetical protein